jgi:hypothetical protein
VRTSERARIEKKKVRWVQEPNRNGFDNRIPLTNPPKRWYNSQSPKAHIPKGDLLKTSVQRGFYFPRLGIASYGTRKTCLALPQHVILTIATGSRSQCREPPCLILRSRPNTYLFSTRTHRWLPLGRKFGPNGYPHGNGWNRRFQTPLPRLAPLTRLPRIAVQLFKPLHDVHRNNGLEAI